MLSEGTSHAGIGLLKFSVPGLQDLALSVTLQEVLEIAGISYLTPIPLTPPSLLGAGEWRGGIITVVDLPGILVGSVPPRLSAPINMNCLVAQVVIGTQRDVIAWPILPDAVVLNVPAQATRADLPPALLPQGVYAALSLEGQTCVLLNLQGIVAYVTVQALGADFRNDG